MSSTPSTTELVLRGAPIALRDGSHVRLRQGHSSDRDLLLRGFERLSAQSRYQRFLAPMPALSDSMLRYLSHIDHRDHEAIVALDEQTGEGLGVARYVRNSEHPDRAEVAVTVIDDWQGRGLGTLLLEVISARAREAGITTFTALSDAGGRVACEAGLYDRDRACRCASALTRRRQGGITVDIVHPVIEVAGLHKEYGATIAVDDVSFTVGEGEIFGILGPNGAGKTTTVECLSGLQAPDGGTVRVLGPGATA